MTSNQIKIVTTISPNLVFSKDVFGMINSSFVITKECRFWAKTQLKMMPLEVSSLLERGNYPSLMARPNISHDEPHGTPRHPVLY